MEQAFAKRSEEAFKENGAQVCDINFTILFKIYFIEDTTKYWLTPQ